MTSVEELTGVRPELGEAKERLSRLCVEAFSGSGQFV